MHGDRRENEQKAMELLSAVGLADAARLRPRELSSGMAARVALAVRLRMTRTFICLTSRSGASMGKSSYSSCGI